MHLPTVLSEDGIGDRRYLPTLPPGTLPRLLEVGRRSHLAPNQTDQTQTAIAIAKRCCKADRVARRDASEKNSCLSHLNRADQSDLTQPTLTDRPLPIAKQEELNRRSHRPDRSLATTTRPTQHDSPDPYERSDPTRPGSLTSATRPDLDQSVVNPKL